MSAPGNTTALRAGTFDNLQLNAGIVLKNLDYSNVADATALKTAIANIISGGANPIGTLVGATRGGGTFTVTRETRTPEIDGMRYGFKGSDYVDSTDAYLSTTLLEVTENNISDLLATGTATVSGKKTTITMSTAITAGDYLTNICWIGDLADGRLVLICLKNAINTADFTFTYTDKGEGTLAAEFHARQAAVGDYDDAPFEVLFFEPDGSLVALTVTSSEGTAVGETSVSVSGSTLPTKGAYYYKIGTTTVAPTIQYNATPDATWTLWDGTSKLNVGAGNDANKITVIMTNRYGRACASGSTTLDVKTS